MPHLSLFSSAAEVTMHYLALLPECWRLVFSHVDSLSSVGERKVILCVWKTSFTGLLGEQCTKPALNGSWFTLKHQGWLLRNIRNPWFIVRRKDNEKHWAGKSWGWQKTIEVVNKPCKGGSGYTRKIEACREGLPDAEFWRDIWRGRLWGIAALSPVLDFDFLNTTKWGETSRHSK